MNRPHTIPRLSRLIFLFFFFLCAALPCFAVEKQAATVTEALTGDTLRLDSGKTLKYIGLQAPPLESSILLVRQYGAEALQFNKSKVAGKKIRVEWGSQIRDNSNNLLGYVFLEDGSFLNKEILKAGHAKVRITPPNTKYAAELRQAELEARRDKRGLWRQEPENPYLKSETWGDKNTKIYYLPNSPELEKIPSSYLVSFRSRVDAKAAGYRPCAGCRGDSAGFENEPNA